MILYADDTSITINNANNSKINNNLKILSNWFINNRLTKYLQKKDMYFYNNTSITNTNETITLNNQTINCVNQYKFIGFYIEELYKRDSKITDTFSETRYGDEP